MRYKNSAYCIIILLIVSLIFIGIPTSGLSQPKSKPLYVPGEILVKFKKDTRISVIDKLRSKIGARIIRRLRLIKTDHFLIAKAISVEQAINLLKSDPNVEYASPNYYRYIDVIPSDPDFEQMWALDNMGQTSGTIDADIDATDAWDISTGSNDIVIAIIDSGAELDHEDLAENIWVNPGEDLNGNGAIDPFEENGIDDDENGFVDDFYGWNFAQDNNDPSPVGGSCLGHGTHTAGTIAAVGNNGIGVTGVNWNAKIMVLNAFRRLLGIFCAATDVDLIEAIEYATTMGVKVSNNSWGGGPLNPAMVDVIRASNMLFVAAAGNGGFDEMGDDTDVTPHYPSSYRLANIVAVAATDHNDEKSFFSNFGASSVDLGAPGSNILSTLPNNAYGAFSGTSMATPHVAGVAGLLLAQDPNYTVRELKWRLLAGVDIVSDLEGKTLTGGRLNAFNALTLPQASETGVTLELTQSGSTTVSRGENVNFSSLFVNKPNEPVFIVSLFYIKLPSGHNFPLLRPFPFIGKIPGGAQITKDGSFPISMFAPIGTYRIFGLIVNPDSLEEEEVQFQIVP